MRFPMNTYLGERTSWRKLFELNVSTISLIACAVNFFRSSFILGEATSSDFFKVTTSTQQLLFRSSYFFRAASYFEELLFQKSCFFATAIFSEQLLFQSEGLPSSQFLRIGSFLSQFVGTATFSMKELVQNKDIYRKTIFIEAGTSTLQELFQNRYFFNKGTFSKEVFFHMNYNNNQYYYCIIISLVSYFHVFQNSYFLEKFFRKAIFRITYSFWRATFSECQSIEECEKFSFLGNLIKVLISMLNFSPKAAEKSTIYNLLFFIAIHVELPSKFL